MVLKTLEIIGPLHGYGIARRIEQTSGDLLAVNYGTLYPALLKLEQEGYISSEWGLSDNNRKAKYYRLTRAGRKATGEGDPRLGPGDRDSRPLLVPCQRGSLKRRPTAGVSTAGAARGIRGWYNSSRNPGGRRISRY